ncbi:Phenylacetyl-CoA ligase [Mycena sanguinolenta]|uniref:Phenylacetyl-CoA ligase n=1 Tax=Mycena sanguinolenta TaxID=230812 RepID=A0A8H6XTP3_9AGAR|nr:Phenylacetyl-CoA ligase [Mycena sanguinolenta]
MTEIVAAGKLPTIPDDLSIPQFQLDHNDPNRPIRPADVPCLIADDSGKRVFLSELRERTQGLANALSALYSIADNEVVLIFSRNHIDYPIAIWAVHRLGGIISPANPDFGRQELEYQLKATKATLVIAHPDALKTATAAAQTTGLSHDRILAFDVEGASTTGFVTMKAVPERKLRPGEGKTKLAFLSFSSGTTGTPKGVAIPHIAVIANVLQLAAHGRVNEDYAPVKDRRYRPGDVALGVLPLYHIYGLVVTLFMDDPISKLHFLLYCGLSIVIVPKFNFENMLKSIVRHRVTHLTIVPPQAVLLCKHPAVKKYDLSVIRFIMIGAAPLSDEVNEQLFALLPDAQIGQAYGTSPLLATLIPLDPSYGLSPANEGSPGGAGVLIPGVTVRVLKADGTLGGYNDVGELVVKSPSNALAYYNNAQATKETFIDGWVRTGDEVKITPDGQLWVIDRIKEIMKVRGFQVAPAELEGTLLDHPDVSDACVVGIPDEYSGEVPLAFVVLSADAAARVKADPSVLKGIKASILKHVADNKVAYKHLAGGVEFVESIPKTPSGKLLRRELRKAAQELRKAPKAKL